MTPSTRRAALYEAGDTWLAESSPRPHLVRQAWNLEALAPIAAGRHWLAVEARLLDTMNAVNRIGVERLGPILADPGVERAWWLIAPDAADDLAGVRRVHVRPEGWPLHCPPTGRYQCGRLWIHRPDGTGQLNDPTLIAAALGPGGGYRLDLDTEASD